MPTDEEQAHREEAALDAEEAGQRPDVRPPHALVVTGILVEAAGNPNGHGQQERKEVEKPLHPHALVVTGILVEAAGDPNEHGQ